MTRVCLRECNGRGGVVSLQVHSGASDLLPVEWNSECFRIERNEGMADGLVHVAIEIWWSILAVLSIWRGGWWRGIYVR